MMYSAAVLAAEENNPLIPHTSELVVGGFGFLVILVLVGKLLVPRIARTLEERTEAIEGGLKRAEETQAEATATLEQYRTQLAEARHEAARLREEARQQGAQIIAEMRAQAQAEAQRITTAAQAQIEADRQQALVALRADVGRLATELAGRIVGESLQEEARRTRVIDRFLDEIDAATEPEQVGR